MVMSITQCNSTTSTNYTQTTATEKASNDNINSNTEKSITQDLGVDTFVKSTEDETASLTYKPEKKKLSTEEVKALKEDQENIKADLIKQFINNTINNQNSLLGKSTENQSNGISKESQHLLTKIFGSLENAYPKMGTTPEEAQKAISEGGAYSVDAVSDRILTMATAIAGDDQGKLQEMREAVEKGFKKAGLEFNNATKSDLPQICNDTYKEVMKRFDELQNKSSDTNQVNTD